MKKNERFRSGPTPADRQQSSRSRKEALRAKFREKEKAAASVSIQTGKAVGQGSREDRASAMPNKSERSMLATMKKRNTTLGKQAKRLQRNQEAAKKELLALRKERMALKREKYEMKLALLEQQSLVLKLREEARGKAEAMKELEDRAAQLAESELLAQINQLGEEKRQMSKRNAKLTQQRVNDRREINALNRQLMIDKNGQLLSYQEQNGRLNIVNENLRRELSAFKDKVAQLEQRIQLLEEADSIERLIQLLNRRLTLATLPQYGAPLNTLIKRIRTLKRLGKSKNLLLREPSGNNQMLGIVKRQEERFVLMDLDATPFPIASAFIPLVEDEPAAAVLEEDGSVNIVKLFETKRKETRVLKASRRRRELTGLAAVENASPELGGLRVLVVGSRNLVAYRDALEAAGAVAETHNPFEESLHMLRTLAERSEAVLVCTSHIPHVVLDHIDVAAPHVELIRRDRVSVILARARYIALSKSAI